MVYLFIYLNFAKVRRIRGISSVGEEKVYDGKDLSKSQGQVRMKDWTNERR